MGGSFNKIVKPIIILANRTKNSTAKPLKFNSKNAEEG